MGERPQILAAVATPFDEGGEVDITAAKSRFLGLRDAVDGIFVTGEVGEFPALGEHERMDLIVTALSVCGPDAVVAHTGAPSGHQAAELTRRSARRGARRFAAITPYYFPAGLSQLVDYYRAVVDAAGSGEVYAYLHAERTGVEVGPDELGWLLDRAGLAGAVVDGAAVVRFVDYVRAAPAGGRIFAGDGSRLVETHRAGGAGVVCAEASVFPDPFRSLAGALGSAEDAVIAERAAGPRDICEVIDGGIGRIKMVQSLRGWSLADMRIPEPPVDTATISALGDLIARHR